MNHHDLQPPQPLPYPDNWLIRKLFKMPVLLYRLNLGSLFGRHILILSTSGRKTKHLRRTPLEYFKQRDRIYIISGFGSQPDWYKNIQADPHVTLQTYNEIIPAIARPPQKQEEWLDVIEYLKHSPIPTPDFKSQIDALDQAALINAIKNWPVLTFDPAPEIRLQPLSTDLVWAWPLILLTKALIILVGWLIQRNKPEKSLRNH